MKVGISTATFFTKELTENCFSVINNCKGECCEVFLTTFSEYEPEFARMLKERIEEEKLEVYSVHSLNTSFEPQLFNAADRTRSDAEQIFRKVLSAGQTIGAKFYTAHGQSRLKKNTYYDPEKVGRRMKVLGDIANEYGITLCLENVHWAAGNSPEFFRKMLPYCENIGTVLDIKQARQSGYEIEDYLDAMGDRLSNIHVSDVDENGNICMVGKGTFDFTGFFRLLDKRGYDGPVIIEQYSGNYEDFSEVAESVKYLKNKLEALKC